MDGLMLCIRDVLLGNNKNMEKATGAFLRGAPWFVLRDVYIWLTGSGERQASYQNWCCTPPVITFVGLNLPASVLFEWDTCSTFSLDTPYLVLLPSNVHIFFVFSLVCN